MVAYCASNAAYIQTVVFSAGGNFRAYGNSAADVCTKYRTGINAVTLNHIKKAYAEDTLFYGCTHFSKINVICFGNHDIHCNGMTVEVKNATERLAAARTDTKISVLITDSRICAFVEHYFVNKAEIGL